MTPNQSHVAGLLDSILEHQAIAEKDGWNGLWNTLESCREMLAKAAPAEVPYALRQWAMEDEPESTLFDEGYNAARRWVKMQLEKPAEPEGDAVKVPRDLLCRWECELDQIPNAFHISDEMAALLGGAGCD